MTTDLKLTHLIFLALLIPSLAYSQDSNSNAFGSTDASLYELKGKVYKLPEYTSYLPTNLEEYPHIATIYNDSLNIPNQKYSNGFPGVEDVFENFAVDFRGHIYINAPGKYFFSLGCDDGARLTINNQKVIDMSGGGSMRFRDGEYTFTKKGIYPIQVEYFQGPRPWIGLMLFCDNKPKPNKILKLSEYLPLKMKENEKQLELSFQGSGVFDVNSITLSNEAILMLGELIHFVKTEKLFKSILIEGHTDDVGSNSYNLNLGEQRALAVKNYLLKNGTTIPVTHKSYGESKPLLPNTSEENRAQNRRIEIKLVK